MDLFDLNNNESDARPLADKMRANNLDDFIGQSHIVAEGSLLRRAIKLDRLGSCIFWGPPGCGKTSAPTCCWTSATASTRRSPIRFCPPSSREPSSLSAPRRKTRMPP